MTDIEIKLHKQIQLLTEKQIQLLTETAEINTKTIRDLFECTKLLKERIEKLEEEVCFSRKKYDS